MTPVLEAVAGLLVVAGSALVLAWEVTHA